MEEQKTENGNMELDFLPIVRVKKGTGYGARSFTIPKYYRRAPWKIVKLVGKRDTSKEDIEGIKQGIYYKVRCVIVSFI
jgi:hypothetical protein